MKYRPENFGKIVETNLGKFFVRQKGNSEPIIWIEPALGGVSAEWWAIQDQLSEVATVVSYDRLGYGWSSNAIRTRTPLNAAEEIKSILDALKISKPVFFIAHAFGGLYTRAFMKRYPSLVHSAVFIDPISPMDCEFKTRLSPTVYKKSGMSKISSYKKLRLLAQSGIMRLFKKTVLKSTPFHFCRDLPNDTIDIEWQSFIHPSFFSTIISEYHEAHLESNVNTLMNMQFHFDCPVTVLCHDKQKIIDEFVNQGRLSREDAQRVENVWKGHIREYCNLSVNSKLIEIPGSSHYIHLSAQKTLMKTLIDLIDEPILTTEIVTPSVRMQQNRNSLLVLH